MIGRAIAVSPPAFEHTSISPECSEAPPARDRRQAPRTIRKRRDRDQSDVAPHALPFHVIPCRRCSAGRQDRFATCSSDEELVARIVTACDGAGQRPLVGKRVGTRQEARSAGLVQLGYRRPVNRHKFIARPNARAFRLRTPLYCRHDIASIVRLHPETIRHRPPRIGGIRVQLRMAVI